MQIAPESFSVAGPRGAYEYYARSAHQDIIDVAVVGPPELAPGYVKIYPLMKGGELPSSEVLASVLEICNADDVRPLTDCVSAHAGYTVYRASGCSELGSNGLGNVAAFEVRARPQPFRAESQNDSRRSKAHRNYIAVIPSPEGLRTGCTLNDYANVWGLGGWLKNLK